MGCLSRAEESRDLINVLKRRGVGAGSGTVIHKTNNVSVGAVENRADVDWVRQILDDEQNRETYV
jgi:hypothetical protein